MRILHISDLHWLQRNADQDIVCDAISTDIANQTKDHKADLLVFSGDLTQAGNTVANFDEPLAYLNSLAKCAGVDEEHIFIAPGNHDLDRDQVRTNRLAEQAACGAIRSVETCNDFIDSALSGDTTAQTAIARFDNFQIAISTQTFSSANLSRIVDIDGRKIGVAVMNSAWRATGESDDVDFRKLWIGERYLDAAIQAIQGADFRIAVFHHPLDWIADEERDHISARIPSSFDLICNGHLHNPRPMANADNFGRCLYSQAPSAFQGRSKLNGYMIIDIDFINDQSTFRFRQYDDKRRVHFANDAFGGEGGTSFGLHIQTRRKNDIVEQIIHPHRSRIRDALSEHLNFSLDSDQENRNAPFVSPPLSYRNAETDSVKADEQKGEVTLDDLALSDQNLIFSGPRTCGKTSILLNLALTIANRGDNQKIPLIIDIDKFKFNVYSVSRSLSNIYPTLPSGFDVRAALTDGLFCFLVDNITEISNGLLDKLAAFVGEFPNNRFVLFGSPRGESLVGHRELRDAFPSFSSIEIHDLQRKQIRTLVNELCKGKSYDCTELYEGIIRQIVRDGLPRTPYMVALLIWASMNRAKGEKLNEAILLSNVIDHLLGAHDFTTLLRRKFDPRDAKLILQELALELQRNGGSIGDNAVLEFLIKSFEERKLKYPADKILDSLVSCGVLKRELGEVSFKYRCFEEFFVAEYLRENDDYVDSLFDNNLTYLDFRREIEIMVGLKKKGDKVIAKIVDVLEKRKPRDFASLARNEFDMMIGVERAVGSRQSDLTKLRNTKFTEEQIDDLMDEVDRRSQARGESKSMLTRLKETGNLRDAAKSVEDEYIARDRDTPQERLSPATFMASTHLLAKVVKNSDFSSGDIKDAAVRRVLESWSKVFVLVMTEVREVWSELKQKEDFGLTEEQNRLIDYMLRKLYFEMISDVNVTSLDSPALIQTLEELLEDKKLTHAEKAFIIFILEDINADNWQDKWEMYISDKESPGFMIDCVIDRIRLIKHTKALDDRQEKRLTDVFSAIEKKLDWRAGKKSGELQDISRAKSVKKLRG